VQCRATGSAHDHPLETKIMLVHLRFMTTLPLRFLPPLHIPARLPQLDGPASGFFDFQFQISRPPMGIYAARGKGLRHVH
jgi:hypothetical protein